MPYSDPERQADYQRQWHAQNREVRIHRQRERRKLGLSDAAAYQAEWRKRNREKYLAHNAVRRALLKGSITKGVCERCGSDTDIHAHHDDYSLRLQVTWLCPQHHAERHAELGWGMAGKRNK